VAQDLSPATASQQCESKGQNIALNDSDMRDSATHQKLGRRWRVPKTGASSEEIQPPFKRGMIVRSGSEETWPQVSGWCLHPLQVSTARFSRGCTLDLKDSSEVMGHKGG
jgi:hypothetical protein